MSIEDANKARFERGLTVLTPLEGELLEALEALLVVCGLEVMEDSYREICLAQESITKAYGETP